MQEILQSSNMPGPRMKTAEPGLESPLERLMHQFTVSNTTVILNSRIGGYVSEVYPSLGMFNGNT